MRPEDFPLGSIESRAAARRLAAHRGNEANRPPDIKIIWDIPAGVNASSNCATESVSRYTHPDGRMVEIEFPSL
jgi:hypothetical protein